MHPGHGSSGSWDFFSNFGHYMPRIHCLQNADGTPDWPWISLLVVFTVAVVASYAKIFVFWIQCYRMEELRDRNRKLMNLAGIFLFCAITGYLMSLLMFVWPAYRLVAFLMIVLAVVSWWFSWNLEPLRIAFSAMRIQREANAELTRSNRELDDFAYAASHDLRSPLRAVENIASWLKEDYSAELPQEAQEDIETMIERLQQMNRLLDDLLSYSKVGRTVERLEKISTKNVVEDICRLLDVPEGFRVVIDPQLPTIVTQRVPLELVLRNLVMNAINHHHQETGTVSVSAKLDGQCCMFSVSDDGPGIEVEHHGRIFEVFKRLKSERHTPSTGIGLAMVKKQVECNGGSISLDSKLGEGSTFSFSWPVTTQEDVSICLN